MIEGVVNAAYEPVITLALQGPLGQSREVEAIVDTGFNGFLTLPTSLVSELGLPFVSIGRATLADGNEIAYEVYGNASGLSFAIRSVVVSFSCRGRRCRRGLQSRIEAFDVLSARRGLTCFASGRLTFAEQRESKALCWRKALLFGSQSPTWNRDTF